jgi:hypothetical protein
MDCMDAEPGFDETATVTVGRIAKTHYAIDDTVHEISRCKALDMRRQPVSYHKSLSTLHLTPRVPSIPINSCSNTKPPFALNAMDIARNAPLAVQLGCMQKRDCTRLCHSDLPYFLQESPNCTTYLAEPEPSASHPKSIDFI